MAKLINHFRPHPRVQYTGELLNHKTGEFFKPVTRVKQSFVAECDINNILKQYSTTGQLKHISAKAATGVYQDLPDEIDFQTSMNIVKQGEMAFATLPSKTRDRFNNDPALFLQFMADPANQDEAIKLGLATDSRPPPQPTPVATPSESSDPSSSPLPKP